VDSSLETYKLKEIELQPDSSKPKVLVYVIAKYDKNKIMKFAKYYSNKIIKFAK